MTFNILKINLLGLEHSFDNCFHFIICFCKYIDDVKNMEEEYGEVHGSLDERIHGMRRPNSGDKVISQKLIVIIIGISYFSVSRYILKNLFFTFYNFLKVMEGI